MVFLINATNLKNGGGLQVAESICCELWRFSQHHFVLALSKFINDESFLFYPNVTIYKYEIKNDFRTLLLGRDRYLDNLVVQEHVDAVLTVFGPSRWIPKVPHLCGFARAQLLLTDSPYYQRVSLKERFLFKIWEWGFRRSSKVFYTENEYISEKLPGIIKKVKVYTVTNYYHQVFDSPESWRKDIQFPLFQGTTLLTISSTAPHKNLGIMVPIAEFLEREYPDFNFRFVLTCDDAPFKYPERLRKRFLFVGKVDISDCPHLYEQADIMFMPSLMECFTATYPEAMRMGIPIVTTDLEFAHGLCGDAASYYSAVDPQSAGNAIYYLATDKAFSAHLVAAGKEQLKKFENYVQRATKLVTILEKLLKD